MQSKLVAAKDYHEVALDIPAFVPDQAALQKELDRLRNPYVTWEPGGAVAAGDMVRCSLHSALPRFQKDSIRFVAGSGMYNPTLEALAIGMQAGESRTATLPEGEVALTVQAVQKRVVPALTDEMAAACKLPGVRTVAGYRRYLLAQQRDKAAAQAAWTLAARIKRAVLDGSAFVLCKADWKQAVEQELDRCRAIARQSGMVLEQMTPEQFAGNIPVKSYAELVAMTQDTCFDSLRCCLLGRHYAQNDGFAVTEAGYAAFLQDYAATWHTTAEEARAAMPKETYTFNQYAAHAEEVWRAHADRLYRDKNPLPDAE